MNIASRPSPFFAPPRSAELPEAPMFQRESSSQRNLFVRHITNQAIAARCRLTPQIVARELWPSDRDLLELVERAASAPAMTTVAGWAAEIAHKVVKDAVAALGPASAAARVIRRGLVFAWDGAGIISVPGFVAASSGSSFVAEGQPIPVKQFVSAAALLNPHKLATISVLTREMMESSNAEAAIGDVLVKSQGAALDTAFFDANAENAARSAGMQYNKTALTPSAATDLWQAAFEDVAALINAIGPVGSGGPYIVLGSPGRAVAMALRFNQITDNDDAALTFYGSSALTSPDILCAIAPAALVAAASPAPEVEAVTAAALVMDDAAPGLPGTTASPEKSVFQTDSIAIKVRWPVSWALRDPRGFAWLVPNWKPG